MLRILTLLTACLFLNPAFAQEPEPTPAEPGSNLPAMEPAADEPAKALQPKRNTPTFLEDSPTDASATEPAADQPAKASRPKPNTPTSSGGSPTYGPTESGDPTFTPEPSWPAKGSKISVYPLKHAEAPRIEQMLKQLFAQNSDLSIVVDERQNMLLIEAEEPTLRKIEELIKVLDAPSSKTESTPSRQEFGGGSRGFGGGRSSSQNANTSRSSGGFGARGGSGRSSRNAGSSFFGGETSRTTGTTRPPQQILQDELGKGSIEELRSAYAELDRKAKQAAANVRSSKTGQPGRKAMLRQAVRQAFETRQKLQRAEMVKFESRLKAIRQSIESRDRIADQIIDHRVDELLDPNLEWEASDDADIKAANAPNNALSSNVETGPAQPDGILRKSPTEFYDLLTEQADSIREIRESIRRLESKTDAPIETGESAKRLSRQLERETQRRNLAEQEYEQQILLLKAQVQEAEARLHLANKTYEFTKRLFQKGYTSSQNLEASRLKKLAAETALEQAKALQKSYQAVGLDLGMAEGQAFEGD